MTRTELAAMIDHIHDLRRQRDLASVECAKATAALNAIAEEVSRIPGRRVLVPREEAPGYAHSYTAVEKDGAWTFAMSGEKTVAELTELSVRVDFANTVWRGKAMIWSDLDRAYKKAVFEAVNS